MSQKAKFTLMVVNNEYVAASNNHDLFKRPSLAGFGKYVAGQVRQALESDDCRIEFSLANEEIRSQFPPCSTCQGTATVLGEGIEGVTFRNEFDAIDPSKRVRVTCPTCSGLGANIPSFWE